MKRFSTTVLDWSVLVFICASVHERSKPKLRTGLTRLGLFWTGLLETWRRGFNRTELDAKPVIAGRSEMACFW